MDAALEGAFARAPLRKWEGVCVGWGNRLKSLHSLRVSCAPHHPNRKNLMETIGLILLVIGFLIALVYGIQLLIVAFRESI